MPTGSFDLSGSPPVLAGPALQTGVFLVTGTADNSYTLIPNVQWLRIDYKEGSNPPVAEFTYLQDDNLWTNLGWPSQFEQLWPIDVPPSPYVVQSDDRVVILAQNPDESTSVMFDGFAQIPVLAASPTNQNVTFAAVGAAVRCFDLPITGRVQRNSDLAGIYTTDGSADIQTDLPTRFNPSDTAVADGNRGGYLPNCSPSGYDTVNPDNENLGSYKVFIDETIAYTPDPRAYWSLAGAVVYLLATYNADETYVNNPDFSTLHTLLQSDYPADNGEFFDPVDDSSSDILIRDYDCTNKPWPEAVAELLSYGGFLMRFDTDTNSDGNPQTDLKIYRRDAANPAAPKLLYLAPAGDPLDPSTSNTTGLHLSRDCNSIANAWAVETSQRRVEASFILAPLYQPATGDLTSADRKQFWASSWTAATSYLTMRKYRWYGVDELGEGYWSNTGEWTTGNTFDFNPLFPPLDNGTQRYVNRYRPGQKALISLDSQGYPRKAELAIAFSQSSKGPSIWTGDDETWQTIPPGKGWRLMDDRLGIIVTEDNPDEWKLGLLGTIIPGGVIRGVAWWADPSYNNLNGGLIPFLRLTTVIEHDLKMPIAVGQRTASPTQFSRWRVADARDHFQYNYVAVGSLYYTQDGGDGTNPYVVRDDTAAATTHAKQLRSAHEMPPLAGSVTLPFITPYYEVGDRLSQISGRDANLTTNVGLSQGESPEYPWVVGVSWTNDADRQQTILQLSGHRAEPRNL